MTLDGIPVKIFEKFWEKFPENSREFSKKIFTVFFRRIRKDFMEKSVGEIPI